MGDGDTDWPTLRLAPGAELIVGWRPRRSRLDAAAIELSQDVASEMQSLCRAELDHLPGLIRRPYGGSPYIEPGEEYLAVPISELASTAPVQAVDADEAADLSDLQRLVITPALPPCRQPTCARAITCSTPLSAPRRARPADRLRTATDPHRVAKAGGLMTAFGQEGLRRFEDPVFVFEAGFDLIISPDEIAVLRLEAFNRMFADLNTLAMVAPANAKKIADMVGQVAPGAVEALAPAAAARPSVARRLQRLATTGAVPSVTPGDLPRPCSSTTLIQPGW